MNFTSHKSLVERNKGNSLISFPDDYTIVDLETTGFSAQFNSIIEIGCIRYRNRQEINRYQTLVKPAEPIPYIIECMTGIHNEMVINSPTFQEIANDVWNFLEGEIIVGHNINFDVNFLYDNFKRSLGREFTNNFIDTLRLARKILPDIKSQGYSGYGLDALCRYFNISLPSEKKYENDVDSIVENLMSATFLQFDRHRGIPDCLLANALFDCLRQFVLDNNIDLSEVMISGKVSLKNIQGNGSNFDTNHVFFGKNCVFTGKLEEFTRLEATQIVADIGGHCEDRITKKTNFLIVGDMDYRQGLNGYETNKLKKARQLIENHQDLQIIPESAFYDLVADYLSDE